MSIPFSKTGGRRSAPKANIAKAGDKAAADRDEKLADLKARAAAANSSVRTGADADGTGHIDVEEYFEQLRQERSTAKTGRQGTESKTYLSGMRSTKSSATSRHRPAVPPAARARPDVPRYYTTTQQASFRQYSLEEMVKAAPWKDRRDGKGDKNDENELREKWHTGESSQWDYTANNEQNEKIDFVHGQKWGLNHMSAGGEVGAF